VNLLWWLQQFYNLKFWIPTGISGRNLTLTDEIVLLEQIKNKLPNNSLRQLVEIVGVLKFTILQVIQQQDKAQDGHYAIDNKDLAKNRSVKIRIQI
jgi:ABC-type ATPase involved in cell division